MNSTDWAERRRHAREIATSIADYFSDGYPLPPSLDVEPPDGLQLPVGEPIWVRGSYRLQADRRCGGRGWFRRRRAAADAAPRWEWSAEGEVYISDRRLYLWDGGWWRWWDWSGISSMSIVDRGSIEMRVQSDSGPETCRLVSAYAEIVFLCWAQAVNPFHVQYQNGAWLPEV